MTLKIPRSNLSVLSLSTLTELQSIPPSTTLLCRCGCLRGTLMAVEARSIIKGHVTHCGCQRFPHIVLTHYTKGGWQSKTYTAWRQVMRQRKSIAVCEDWMDFYGFLCGAGRCPGAGYSFRRVDRSRGFFPGNALWVPGTHSID